MHSPFSNASQSDGRDKAYDGVAETATSEEQAPAPRQLTFRALIVGLLVGSLLCCSNTYFGLQSGWISMGSLQSAILGFGIFRLLERSCSITGFTVEENVILQTTAVATATMPLAAGLVGVVPAYGMLEPPLIFPPGQLILWSLALAFIGVFCAVPLRTQTILKEKLKFPSGTATANVIRTLHGKPQMDQEEGLPTTSLRQRRPTLRRLPEGSTEGGSSSQGNDQVDDEGEAAALLGAENTTPRRGGRLDSRSASLDMCSARNLMKADSVQGHCSLGSKMRSMKLTDGEAESGAEFDKAWRVLLATFGIAGVYSFLGSLWGALKSFPVFTWVGLPGVTAWGWELSVSLGYVGQGMIMGPRTAASMLLGAVAGYGVLGPLARRQGWAPGPIGDWETGATGWILWISLSIMLADSLTSLTLLLVSTLRSTLAYNRERSRAAASEGGGCPPIPTWVWVAGLLASTALCTAVLSPMLHMSFYQPIAAVVLALFVSVLAVRALGETDLNPVSGVGKLSQVVFAFIAPGQVVANLAAGAVAEAGAQQAGDMMQDFKTAHLLGVCPRSQFVAMLLGSGASVFVSVGSYQLFSSFYQIPSAQFPVPTARIWLDMAKLVNGGSLPPKVLPFCIGGAVLGASLPLLSAFLERQVDRLESSPLPSPRRLKLVRVLSRCVPSGIGFAIGIYVQAKWTIPRVIGSLVEQVWLRRNPKNHQAFMIVVASGLVLGEGTAAIAAALVKALQSSISGS